MKIYKSVPDWLFNYFSKENLFENILLKKASLDNTIKYLKEVSDFDKYFLTITDEDKIKLNDLEKRLDKGKIDKGYYNRVSHVIKNKYFYTSDLYNEFYLYTLNSKSKNDTNNDFTKITSIDMIEFAHCNCLTLYHDGQSDPWTISVINKCDKDGNITGPEIFHENREGILQDYLTFIKERVGFSTTDGTYLFGLELTNDINELKAYI